MYSLVCIFSLLSSPSSASFNLSAGIILLPYYTVHCTVYTV